MNTHRKIIPIAALAMACAAVAPASAPASPLLSGYGGPGQGTQAILGSTLLNGPSGGGGGAATGSGASTTVPAEGLSSANGKAVGSSSGKRSARGKAAKPRSAAGKSPGAFRTPPALSVTRASAGSSGPLGLSDTEFLVALMALAALLFTGLLTRGLAKASSTRWHAGS